MKVKQQNLRSWLKHQPEYDSRTCQEKLLSATAQTPWNSETQHQHCARNPRQTTHRNDLPLRSLDPSPDTVVYEDGALARQWSEELIEHALRPDSPLLTHAYLLNPTAGNLDDAEKARDRRRKHFFKAKPKHCRDWSYDKKRPEEAGKKQEKCEEKQRRKQKRNPFRKLKNCKFFQLLFDR
ncbi:hypothetical protein KEM54_002351 [Ascosphaera aggregata]|nr:hypothetical protein KEM54_002351 [Ascosphaera aggregata]